MKSGTRQDEAGETNAFTILDKPQSEPLIQFYLFGTLSCRFLTATGPACTLSRHRRRSDRQGQGNANTAGNVDSSSTGGRGSTNKIAVERDMRGVLKCLYCCQEEVPGFIGGTNRARQGSDSLAVAHTQPDTLPPSRTRCPPLFLLPSSHLQLSSQVVPFALFFVFLVWYLLSITANLLFLWGGAACAESQHNNSRSQ